MQRVWETIGVSRLEWKNAPWYVQRMVLISLDYPHGSPKDSGQTLMGAWIQDNAEVMSIKDRYNNNVAIG